LKKEKSQPFIDDYKSRWVVPGRLSSNKLKEGLVKKGEL
jgi:hypothetical protein